MTSQYRTIQGDMWDWISWKLYKTERFANVLMRENAAYLSVVTFNAGTILTVPAISTTRKISSVPWGSVYVIN